MSGMEVLEILGRRQATVIVLTGQGEIETAVEAIRLGAENFLVKPVDLGQLSAAIEKASEKSLLRRDNVALKRQLNPSAKRCLTRLALLPLLVLVSAGVGRVFGDSGGTDRLRNPIPVPLDSADTLRNRQRDQSPDSR
jgi:CheY-like chemotaxis protein